MKIILSPAKNINDSAELPDFEFSSPIFLNETHKLVTKLKKLSPKQLMKMMSISADLAEKNYERFQNYSDPIVLNDKVLPACFAFNGEVYRGFNASTLSIEELKQAHHKIFILSGLYGVLKPLDLMYPYRLEMGTKLHDSFKMGSLYEFWKEKVSSVLKKELSGNELLINLASNEYSKVIDKIILNEKTITPIFKDFKNGEYRTIMMYAKHTRGAMARHIIQNKIEYATDLKNSKVEGYEFNDKLSNEKEWVFVR
jgi:cytoplasmic iron level regulating protein YaaA (DUF328/UPF0246 family)